MSDKIKIYPMCDMLVDQNRYIGNDPVGYKCLNRADYEIGDYFICENCWKKYIHEPHRITLGLPTVKMWHDKKYMKNKISNMLEVV